ncbi:YqgE/AlgH family protein [Pasteurellaceae bacterium USgator11]|nr:YqgE/AlgH family protein [Pasteurellaceae bacterium UScroc12]TNG97365.1 YqgE/AlgH family protein [Pasteurellaceae bacterium USgator41]TNH00573.1 YqgE/AlgH family protein [Pasteurellaceae bacterium UScroc31]TNH03234.1 YqgE/AlgH family protein [Pasteurellaceae bacterium USgator11]
MKLQDHFLLAMPGMDDPFFKHALIYICEHNSEGAMGIMLTQVTDLSVAEIIAKMNFLIADQREYRQDDIVLMGGPVNLERGFILHSKCIPAFEHSYAVSDQVWMTTSADVLQTIGRADAPEKYLVALGCCRWRAEQLEQEIADNVWLVLESNPRLLFDVPYDRRWLEANRTLGFEPTHLTALAGHA